MDGLPARCGARRGRGVVAGRKRGSESEPLVACKEHDRAMIAEIAWGASDHAGVSASER